MLDKEQKEKRTGRTTIDDRARTNSFSKRAAEGKLAVIRKHCPHCGHHKALSTSSKTKCARCKREINT